MPRSIHLHLVSDSSGETVSAIARACLVQFEGTTVTQHLWWLVRTPGQTTRVLDGVARDRGLVVYTVVDPTIREQLEAGFRDLEVPHIPVLDPVMNALSGLLQAQVEGRPGRQHVMDASYFRRIDAMQYTIEYDDGQAMSRIDEADIILFGVSRTSKTPLSIYLANRGLKTANVPVVPGIPLPPEALQAEGPLKVGLTREPRSLADIRRNRLRVMRQAPDTTTYADEETVRAEVLDARRLFARHGFPVIDMTRKSIEEAAAAILQLHIEHSRKAGSS